MKTIIKYLILATVGGSIYACIEILWRGYTHLSMVVVGAMAFLLIGGLNNWLPWEMQLQWQCVCGGVLVTVIELIAGVILNFWLGLGIWDYSTMPLNLLGQICLPFSLAWCGLSLVGILLDDFLRWKWFDEQKPHYSWKRSEKSGMCV